MVGRQSRPGAGSTFRERAGQWLPSLLLLLVILVVFRNELRNGVQRVRSRIAARHAAFPAPPGGRILDGAHAMDAGSRSTLEELTRTIEDRTTAEVDVVTVPGLQGMTVEDYANRLFNVWKIGKKGKNNGVLLLIAPVERKVRIEVGYGLEGSLPDGLCGEIIRENLVPAFKEGAFGPGAVAAVRRIGDRIGAFPREDVPELTSVQAQSGIRQIDDAAGLLTPRALDLMAHYAGLFQEQSRIAFFVQTVPSLQGRPIESEARRRLARLPEASAESARTILLLVEAGTGLARIEFGSGLRDAFSQPQADRLAANLTATLREGNVVGAFWSTAADLDSVLAGRMKLTGGPRPPDQARKAREYLAGRDGMGLVWSTLFVGVFVTLGAGFAAAGAASRTVFLTLFGAAFGGFPLVAFGLTPVSLGLWWPIGVHLGLAAAGALIGWSLGRRRRALRMTGRGGSGWSWGGGGGFGGSGGSGGGGGGSSGGGGASGSW